jgi:ATP-binding cassette subfamily B protein
MIGTVRNLGVMLQSSWRADRTRTIGALTCTALLPVTRPLRAIGLALLADGIVAHDTTRATAGAVIVAGLTAAGRLFDWASVTVRMRLREHTILYLDQRVMELTAGITGLEHHERPEYQDQLEVMRAERERLVNPFMPVAWTVAVVIQLVTTVVVLARLSPVLALLPVAAIPSLLIGTIVESRRRRLRDQQAEVERLRLHLMDLATQASSGKEVRVFGLGPELARRHQQSFVDSEDEWVRFNVRAGAMLSAGWMVFALGYMGSVWFVASRVVDRSLSVGAAVLTLSMGAQLTSQLSELVGNFSWFSRTANAIGRFRWLRSYATDSHLALQPRHRVEVPARLQGGVTFDNVTFAYPRTDRPVLRNFCLHIPAGSTVAIVGDNGAGKTTLAKLLCRFYEPTGGTISIDGIELNQLDAEEWRSRISAGFQDFAQLQFLARQSVGIGDLAFLDNDLSVMQALDRAAASDVLTALPDQLDTQLGREFDGGVELSLGQWQKLALGRAMMRPSPLVLILDEPTASLDADTEHALFERFAGAAHRAARRNGAITVLVSHRFSTVRMADLIAVVGNGRIMELGNHRDLMAAEGIYADLYRMQARGYQ